MDKHTADNGQQENEERAGGQIVPSTESGSELEHEIQPPGSLLPATVTWKRSRGGLKVMARKPKMEESGVAKTEGKRRKPYLVEHDPQKTALAYYFALGAGRSLSQVAKHFKKKLNLVQKWSSCLNWAGRIKALENRSVEETFKEKAISTLNLIMDSLTKKDKTGKLVLASSERTAVEKLKLAVDSFKRIREDTRETESHQKEMDRGPGGGTSGKNRGGFMVNVVIQK